MSVLNAAGTVFRIQGKNQLYYMLPPDLAHPGKMTALAVSRTPTSGLFFSVSKNGGNIRWSSFETFDEAEAHQISLDQAIRQGIRYNPTASVGN